jgi:hypothetical protein
MQVPKLPPFVKQLYQLVDAGCAGCAVVPSAMTNAVPDRRTRTTATMMAAVQYFWSQRLFMIFYWTMIWHVAGVSFAESVSVALYVPVAL